MSDQRKFDGSGVGSVGGSGDRRRACRYRVGSRDASLGRHDASSGFVEGPCRIIDVSLAGCLVESGPLPKLARGQSVWLRPAGIAASDWAEASVVAVRKPWFRSWQIRVEFLAELPYSSFRPLVFEKDPGFGTADRAVPEHEMDHFWR